ncbi:MAG TPA: HipA domain-containing protein [Arachnia sp.]|nr:HipA domain-containing protein [Arachnia sp.]HMT87815.1 HipA domain-containing protein [Arachnia sp.]
MTSTPASLDVSTAVNGEQVLVGTAHFTRRRGTVTTTFRYADSYLANRGAYPIDPAFSLYSGAHVSTGLPGAFSDCAPDRWGKNLITKRIQALAARENRPAVGLSDVDFLIGVSDLTRQGALRFQAGRDEPFLDPASEVPKLVELPRLMRAADSVARDGGADLAAIKELLDAGSGSLGGARPKASVRDGDRLLIAKFPHPGDEWDVMAWERTALDLAELAGIRTPHTKLLRVDGASVLLLDRFDRQGARRVPYISAMTLLGARDGDMHDYTEIAETLVDHAVAPKEDLRELWRRIAFSIAVHDTDDHLRNHGFLRAGAGWTLAPVFDVNPNPDPGTQRVTGIGGARERGDEVEALIRYADVFDMDAQQAQSALGEVASAVERWREVAARNGINSTEMLRFQAVFDGGIRPWSKPSRTSRPR